MIGWCNLQPLGDKRYRDRLWKIGTIHIIEDWNSLKVKSENITQDIIQLFHDDFDTCALNGYYSATYEMRKLATNHVHTVKSNFKTNSTFEIPAENNNVTMLACAVRKQRFVRVAALRFKWQTPRRLAGDHGDWNSLISFHSWLYFCVRVWETAPFPRCDVIVNRREKFLFEST